MENAQLKMYAAGERMGIRERGEVSKYKFLIGLIIDR
jgi:hypothetical protein